jgi:hypothetical protein
VDGEDLCPPLHSALVTLVTKAERGKHMNKDTRQFSFIMRQVALLLFVGGYLFMLTSHVYAETTVVNSVYAGTNGTGESQASVTTIINGEVVEDWSSTSSTSIKHSNTVVVENDSVINTTNTSQANNRDHMVELIAHLEALIALYVSLLSH